MSDSYLTWWAGGKRARKRLYTGEEPSAKVRDCERLFKSLKVASRAAEPKEEKIAGDEALRQAGVRSAVCLDHNQYSRLHPGDNRGPLMSVKQRQNLTKLALKNYRKAEKRSKGYKSDCRHV